ncbi:thiosulfate sulfurtransferase, partial [Mycobacterium avium 11-0986]
AAGGRLVSGPVEPAPGNVTVPHDDLHSGNRPTVTTEQVTAGAATLIDARAPERYRGEMEPLDPVAGHIPGAENLPSGDVLAADGTFLDDDALARVFAEHRIERHGAVAAYCGSGVTATVTIAALAAVGRTAALYPGSWSEWCADPARPVERGGA